MAFSEDAVSLRNVEFPLFGKEMSRTDFEEKLRENPANDHLKVIVTESQKKETPAEKQPDLSLIHILVFLLKKCLTGLGFSVRLKARQVLYSPMRKSP